MGINRGKQFEDRIRRQFEKLEDTFVLRLYDVTMGYAKIDNPCDLIVYRDGTLNLLECKAIHGNALNFKSHIRENQWNKLLNYTKLPGVNAGILVWFIDTDETFFIDIYWLSILKLENYKSWSPSKEKSWLYVKRIDGVKKRTFFEYDLDKFLKEIEYG